MKPKYYIWISIICISIICASAIAQQEPPDTKAALVEKSADAETITTDTKSIPVTQAIAVPQKVPESFFMKVKDEIAAGNTKNAATELRKSIEFLKQMESQMTDNAKVKLTPCIQDSEKMAADLDAGTIVEDKALSKVTSRVLSVLASNHQAKIMDSINKNEMKGAGHELSNTLLYLQQALSWIGQKPDASMMSEGMKLADTLISGGNATPVEVITLSSRLGMEIEKTGKLIDLMK